MFDINFKQIKSIESDKKNSMKLILKSGINRVITLTFKNSSHFYSDLQKYWEKYAGIDSNKGKKLNKNESN